MAERKEAVKEDNGFVKNIPASKRKRNWNGWTVADGSVLMQVYAVHLVYFHGNVCKGIKLFETYQHIPLFC